MSKRHNDKDFGPKRSILLKLTVIARQLRTSFDQRVTSIGVTRSQWTLVAVIANRPGATQREVAAVLEMSEASVGRLIDRLCADGVLERRRKDDDRRAHCVFLTSAAEPILEQISVLGKEHEDLTMAGLGEDDLVSLEHCLDVIAANLAKAPGPKSPQ